MHEAGENVAAILVNDKYSTLLMLSPYFRQESVFVRAGHNERPVEGRSRVDSQVLDSSHLRVPSGDDCLPGRTRVICATSWWGDAKDVPDRRTRPSDRGLYSSLATNAKPFGGLESGHRVQVGRSLVPQPGVTAQDSRHTHGEEP